MIIRKTLLASAALALVTSLGATGAQAVNLVTNGSFETGDLTGWTSTEGSYNPFGTTYGSGMDGKYWHWLAGYERPVTTTQTISGLTVGTKYSVTFLMASEFTARDAVRLTVGGDPGVVFTAPAYGGGSAFWDTWVSQRYDFIASATSTLLQFDTIGLNVTGYDVGVDKISLEALSGSVPEPTTWALMILGFGAVGMAARNRRRAAVAA